MRKSSRLKRATVDTNLFVSGLIIEKGLPYQLLEQLRRKSFVLINSQPLRSEIEEVLRRAKFSASITEPKIKAFLLLLDVISVMVVPQLNLPVEIRDPKDEKILATALGGEADYLVTGDKDLLDLKDNPKLESLKIVTAKEFLQLLSED